MVVGCLCETSWFFFVVKYKLHEFPSTASRSGTNELH